MEILKILSLLLVGLVIVPPVAHALELPGKLRLSKDEYFIVQGIYYPGFTWVGMAEPFAVFSLLLVLVFMPLGLAFWLTALAMLALSLMHGIYWKVTHPLNKLWASERELNGPAANLFALETGAQNSHERHPHRWFRLRDRWEHSHLARAALAATAFVLLILAVVMGP